MAVTGCVNVFIERIQHAGPGGDSRAQPGEIDEALQSGREFSIEPGKRAEFEIAPGQRAVVYLLQGSARFEGDDTPAVGGDTVWFKPPPDGSGGLLGVEADTPVRGVLVSRPVQESRRKA